MARRKRITSELDYDELMDAIDKIDGNSGMAPANIKRAGTVEDSISIRSLTLDLATGGGLAPSKISGAFGFEGSGKSTAFFHTVLNALDMGIPVIFYDFEGADPFYLARIGLDLDHPMLRIYQPDTGDMCYRHMRRVLKAIPERRSGRVSVLFGIDSIPGMLPEAFDENDEANAMAQAARMHSQKIPFIRTQINIKRAALFMINQLRTKPGVSFGNPEYEPGGIAVKQFSDMRMKMAQIAPSTANKRTLKSVNGKGGIEEEDCWDGNGKDRYTYSKFITVKNKAFSPFREGLLRFWFEERGEPGRGIDPVFDTFQYLEMTGQVKKAGAWYTLANDLPSPAHAGQKYQWKAFKREILENLDSPTCLRAACRKQLTTGDGFKLYFQDHGGVKVEEDVTDDDPFVDEDFGEDFDNVVTGSFEPEDE